MRAAVVMLAALAAACGGEDVMQPGQTQRIDAASLQSFVTWGGRQSIANIQGAAIGLPETFRFPSGPGFSTFPLPPGGIATLEQLVDMRYPRPTTWTVTLYAVATTPMPVNDQYSVTWVVHSSVGRANNDLRFTQRFVSNPGTTDPAQSVLTTFQLAAQTIQIVPSAVTYSVGNVGSTANQSLLAWSAWVAPVFE